MSINAQANSIDELFSSNVHYRVPHYQRRYVWDETNWDRLWKDILFQINGEVEGEVEGEDHPTHFTGPIVTRSIGKKAYEVIDGQQRLATFQIILCVIRDLCETQEDPQQDKLAKSAAKYIINDEDVLIDDPDYEFTFVPTVYDQPAFRQVTSETHFQNRADSDGHSILKAYNHFAGLIQGHVGDNLDFEKMRRLLRSITDNFVLVKLELGGEDERPEQVFASINATGRKLSEFDYLRNDLFLRAGKLGIDPKSGKPYSDVFYRKYWVFENDSQYWGEDTLESFLRAFLMAKRGPDCFEKNAKHFEVYQQYREGLTAEQGIKYEFKQLQNYAETYRKLDTNEPTDIRMRFYKVLDFMFEDLNTTAFVIPIVLFLTHEVALSNEKFTQVFDILESYIIRGLLHHGVNDDKTLKKLLEKIKKFFIHRRRNFCVRNFAKYLSDKPQIWLDDQQVVNGLRQTAYQMPYSGRDRRRFVMNMLGYILYRIECWKIGHWNQENPSKEGKKVRFYPRGFLRPTEADGPQEDIQTALPMSVQLLMPESKRHKPTDLYSIGNLAFCKEHLPNHLSFHNIKNVLSQETNADIMLNREICEKYENLDRWGAAQIREQEEILIRCFHEMWPPPEHFIGQVPKPEVERKTQLSDHTSESIAKLKVEAQWVSMLQSDNYQSAMFVTYTKSVEMSKINKSGNTFTGLDHSNEKQTLEKPNILFACSSVSWPEVDPYIEILPSVRRERLNYPSRDRSEQLNIMDRFLQSARDRQVTVFPVTRYGHQLEGTIEDFDKDAIYMQIRECPVIVYRHGLYEFAMDEWHQGVVTEFDEDRRFGYIKSNRFRRHIFVHIEEVRDRSISTLQPNQRVEFDLNHTTKGTRLAAINVELIEE